MPQQIPGRHRGGFATEDILIVAALIVVLAIAFPMLMRARKRTAATRILDDLRLIDNAANQYALNPAKTQSPANNSADLFGGTFGPFTVDSIPLVPASQLDLGPGDMTPAGFWSPYSDAGSSAK